MSWRIVPASILADLVGLQPLAEHIFGTGDRRPDWFARKLARECVDPALSSLAITGDDPRDPTAWLGYVLVGRPASRWPIARAAGTGVLPAWRGAGVATALLDAAAATSAAAGASHLELWAERTLEPFYLARGFALARRVTSLLAFARGGDDALPAPRRWDAIDDAIEIHAYLAEAWEHAPADARHTLSWPDACVHVCREGRAFALHRTAVREPSVPIDVPNDVFDRVLARLPAAAPVIAIALPEVSSITASLRTAGWVDVQRSSILLRANADGAGHRSQRPG